MNLLKETIAELKDNGVNPDDVRWVGNHEGWCTWHEFSVVATNINYDAGYGTEWINQSLVVVGDDWWMERHNYDGSEWWEFKRLPE